MRSERKIVTVLFADIKGSIDLVAYHDPEQAGDVLAEVVSEMGAAVRTFGGVVNQIMGDGIMALFGAPLAIEEHAAQACRAALAMRQAVREKLRTEVHIRVGLGSGEVVVRAMPGDVTLHYSAAGEAVHFASRMEQVAAPDQIVLTAATLAMTGGLAAVRSLGPVPIKGLDAPMEVFELLWMAERRTRTALRGTGGSSFVGREQELALLQDALDHAAAGEARAVRVIAEAGCGKSRLVSEFTAGRLPGDWSVSMAEALPHRRTSYAAVVDLLAGVFQLAPEDDATLRRDKVLAGLGVRASEAEEQILPGIAALVGLPPAPGWQALEPRERRDRTIAAATLAMHEASRHRPMALVIEDAHWLDPESAESIQRLGAPLGAGASGLHMLAIATERPPDSPFTDPSAWSACHLSALDERGTHALLGGLLLPGPDVPALERKLMEHTRGNPLFIEECLRALVDVGELQRVGSRYRLERPVEELRVPDSLRGLLDTRVDRLADLEKDVLQAAAVVGTSMRGDLLRRVADLDPAALNAALGRLCQAGFLVEVGTAETGNAETRRYAFRHGLIREAAYNGILLRSRVRMHGAVLAALEEREGHDDADLLADHASRAEAWAKAVRYSRLAASRALDRYANPESARYYRQALAALEHWPDGPEKEKTQLGLHLGIRWPLFRLGHVRQLLPHLDQAARLAARHDDHVQLGQSHALRSHVMWMAGKPDQAEAAAEAARVLAVTQGDRDLEVRALFQLALVHLTGGRVAEIITALEEVIAHIGPAPPRTGRYALDADLVVTSLSYIARAHTGAGAFAEAQRAIKQAAAEARALGRRQPWIYVHVAHGVALLGEARPHQAVGELEAAYTACNEVDMRLLRPVAGGFLALAYAESGQPEKGAALAQQSVDDAERMGFFPLQPMRLAILAQARLLCGDLDGAESAANAAAALAVEIREPGAEAYATGLRGEILLRRGEAERAQDLFRAGMDQAEALGLRPLAASIRQRLEDPENRAHPWLDGVALAP
jgi:class 3 adenylate cyclase/tetratricopeptide (TPR) repeat protein